MCLLYTWSIRLPCSIVIRWTLPPLRQMPTPCQAVDGWKTPNSPLVGINTIVMTMLMFGRDRTHKSDLEIRNTFRQNPNSPICRSITGRAYFHRSVTIINDILFVSNSSGFSDDHSDGGLSSVQLIMGVKGIIIDLDLSSRPLQLAGYLMWFCREIKPTSLI
jgi:hypothetical protein